MRRRLQREAASLELLQPPHSPQVLAEARRISDDWLTSKSAHEKRFSVGYFDEAYLANFPLALVRVEGRIVAFANVWTAGRQELSLDLMRYAQGAPSGTMDFLFVELMLWGKEQGYEQFNLGMAPLSGLEQRPLAPVWHRMGRLVSGMGEHFYNFEGLRRYKQKFLPQWEPRYLAAPGGLVLPRVLLDVTTLIAGGLREIVAK
jgi:phosphatidylglycerol lysyltransferase